MDIYHIWRALKPGTSDPNFVRRVGAYLGHLVEQGVLASFRVTRCKLGFRPPGLGEFHLTLEFLDLAQLDQAFQDVSSRAGAVEGLHEAVNSKVRNIVFALYRDFPDATRVEGEERFQTEGRSFEESGSVGSR